MGSVQSISLRGQSSSGQRRRITSCWHLTINSNFRERYGDSAFNDMIRNALNEAIQAPLTVENRGSVFYFDHGNDYWTPNIEGFPEHVYNIRLEYADEVGSRQNKLHVHGIICVEHDSRVKINVRKLREIINNVMATETGGLVTKPYIYLRFLSNSVEIAKRYISKEIPKIG